jgi:hypothetical protein
LREIVYPADESLGAFDLALPVPPQLQARKSSHRAIPPSTRLMLRKHAKAPLLVSAGANPRMARNPAAKEKIVLARFGYFRELAQHRFADDLPVQVAK